MPDVQGRVEELRREAEAAIGAASDVAELEELRVRYLGRKAELTGILRGIAALPAGGAGPRGRGRKRGQGGAGGAARRRRAELDAVELEQRTGHRRGGRDLARDPGGAGRLPQPADSHPARDRGRLRRARLPGDGGARGRARLLQLHRPQPPARSSRADGAGHLLRRSGEPGPRPAHRAVTGLPGRAGHRARAAARARGRCPAHPHLADAGEGDGGAGAADLHRRPRSLLSQRPLRRDPQPRSSIRSRASRWRRTSRSPTSRGPSTSSRGRSSGPSAPRASVPGSSPSPSRASRWMSPASAAAARGSSPTARGTPSARARAGSRSSARGWWIRTCSAS